MPPALVSGRRDAPPIVQRAVVAARFAWAKFFGGQIENGHPRWAYRHAVQGFLAWCDARGLELQQIAPAAIGEHLEGQGDILLPRHTRMSPFLPVA